jgi:hypothetical protein
MNHRHMTDDHHGRTAGRATLLVRAADEILGTHTMRMAPFATTAFVEIGRFNLTGTCGMGFLSPSI